MKKRRLVFGGVLLLLVLFNGCGQQTAGIDVEDVWARPGLVEGNSAVFFVVSNHGESEERMVAASSDVAGAVELHKSKMVDGAMKMEMQKFIAIPTGGEVVFKPGDFHVMLIGLKNDLAVGDEFQVNLEFESGVTTTLDVVVREP